jgi:predicted methyltransferase
VRVLFALVLLIAASAAQAANEIDDKVTAALAAESRPDADRMRDRNRLALRTLTFFGLKDNMRVLELIPGGGWYSRVLAPVLADNGQFYVSIGTNSVKEKVLTKPGFENVVVLENDSHMHRPKGSPVYVVNAFDFGVTDLDMVLTFRNQHNFGADGRATINSAVFKALKPGGLYGVVDHTRRHMESNGSENRRRLDPVLVIQEMLEQGFEFVDYSTLHYRADDELEYEVGRKSVTGNTDRFTLLFQKPEAL